MQILVADTHGRVAVVDPSYHNSKAGHNKGERQLIVVEKQLIYFVLRWGWEVGVCA